MRAIIYFRDFLVVVGVIALISLTWDAYEFLFPGPAEPQKDLFDWKIIDKYPNSDKTVVAVLEHGESNTGANTAPIYRLRLQTTKEPDKWRNHWNVWNSQVTQAPQIKWLNDNNIEIKQINYRVWEYEPSVELNNQIYGVHLIVLHNNP